MARVKPSNLQPVRSPEEANEAIREVGEIKRILAAIENRMNDDIASIKAEAAADSAQHRTRLEALENGILAFAEMKKDELFDDKKRSLKLDFGTIGYRRSHEIGLQKGSTWKSVLGKLRELAFKEAIRIKEEPDKEVMSTWPSERLDLVGCEKKEKDTFWYEVDEIRLAAAQSD